MTEKLKEFSLKEFNLDLDQFGKWEKDYKFERAILILYARNVLGMTYNKIGLSLRISRQRNHAIAKTSLETSRNNSEFLKMYYKLVDNSKAHK